MALDELKREADGARSVVRAGGEADAMQQTGALFACTPPRGGCEACFEGRWHVARHRPFEGATIAERVEALGFEAKFLRVEVRKAGRDDVLRPLFPGYLFVRFDAAVPTWTAILRVNGIVGLLGRPDGTPIALPEREADAVFSCVDPWGILRTPRPAAASAKPLRGGIEMLRVWLDRHAGDRFVRAA